MSSYLRLSEGFTKYRLIKETPNFNIWDHIKSPDTKDYYVSLFKYNDSHFKKWQDTGSVAGITDVTTDTLFFDFDSSNDLELAKKDAEELITRLHIKYGIPYAMIHTCFSGSKGFSVSITLEDQNLSSDQLKNTCYAIAGDLSTFDLKIYDTQRIVRVPLTKHMKTGLFKLPLAAESLASLSIEDIKLEAQTPNSELASVVEHWETVPSSKLSKDLLAIINAKPKINPTKNVIFTPVRTEDLDFRAKPKHLTNCRWALQNGFFSEGDRSNALLCLAATYKNQGFGIEHTYRLLKAVAELASQRTGEERFPDDELYNNIVMQVYSEHWNNGQYSCRTSGWLQSYCVSLGHNKCTQKEEEGPRHIHDITDKFKDYVVNIDKNTIKTGIKSLDAAVFLSTGVNAALVGAPAAGKSAIAIDILNNTSKAGIKSVFASLDMSSTRIYEKIMYRLTGSSRTSLYEKFQKNEEGPLVNQLKEEFGNVFFFDKVMPSVADIRDYVIECQERTGEKIKLVMVDYFERVYSDVTDDTASSKRVAADLQNLVNELDICLITLVQPNKMSGDLSEEITSYTSIKGSSFLGQSYRIIMGIHRPGFNPKRPEDDRFMTINILKNDLGETASLDFAWNGKRGRVSEIDQEGRGELAEIIARAKQAKSDEDDSW